MQILNATGLHRKSGGAQWRDLRFFPRSDTLSSMAIWMLANLDQNFGRPIQVLLLLFRVPATMPGQVNQVRSHLNADVQRPAFEFST
jgi:hypothetical protein